MIKGYFAFSKDISQQEFLDLTGSTCRFNHYEKNMEGGIIYAIRSDGGGHVWLLEAEGQQEIDCALAILDRQDFVRWFKPGEASIAANDPVYEPEKAVEASEPLDLDISIPSPVDSLKDIWGGVMRIVQGVYSGR